MAAEPIHSSSVARALVDPGLLAATPYDPSHPFWVEARAHAVHLILAHATRAPGAARAMLHQAAAIDLLRQQELERLLAALHEQGIDCLVFKGAAVSRTVYAQSHLRPRDDADLLVRLQDLEKTARALLTAGYDRAIEASGDLLTSQIHFNRGKQGQNVYALDVHWKIANPRAFSECLSADECFRAAVPLPTLGPHARTLSPTHALFLACIHRIAHHQDEPSLLWLWDIHLLAASMTDDELGHFASLALAANMSAVCARSLELTAEAFDSARPRQWAAQLRTKGPGGDEPSATFVGGGLRQLDVVVADLRALETWSDRFRLAREHLFPPRTYIKAVYPRCPRGLLPLAYLHRVARGAAKWFRRPGQLVSF